MGGYGSGRRNYQLKTLVEDCLSVSVSSLRKVIKRVDAGGGILTGTIYWTGNGSRLGDMGYQVYRKNSYLVVHLSYRTTNTITNKVKELDYPIRIQYTRPYFGGKRFWFTCPLVINGRACLKRVGMLYQPPGGSYFGCRQCYDLVYTSSRDSHKWDSLRRSIEKEDIMFLSNSNSVYSLLKTNQKP